jgi:hypothetical protein
MRGVEREQREGESRERTCAMVPAERCLRKRRVQMRKVRWSEPALFAEPSWQSSIVSA